jgi:hypothetical protein
MSKKINVVVPVCWEDVDVTTYARIQQISSKEYPTELAHTTELVKCLCNIDEVYSLPISTFNTIAKEIGFISTPVPSEKKEEIVVDGELYRWVSNFNGLTVGEVISIEQVIDLEELTFSLATDVVAAILLRKVLPNGELEEFDSNLFNERRELFGRVPITDVNGMLGFFLLGGQTSTKPTYLFSVTLSRIPTSTQKRSSVLRRLLKRVAQFLRFTNG